MDINTLFTSISGTVNLVIIIALMALGYIIKHTKALSKISNNLIPLILLVSGIIISIVLGGSPVAELIISGIINAAVAIALHQAGKNIFEFLPSTVAINDSGGTTEEEEIEAQLEKDDNV